MVQTQDPDYENIYKELIEILKLPESTNFSDPVYFRIYNAKPVKVEYKFDRFVELLNILKTSPNFLEILNTQYFYAQDNLLFLACIYNNVAAVELLLNVGAIVSNDLFYKILESQANIMHWIRTCLRISSKDCLKDTSKFLRCPSESGFENIIKMLIKSELNLNSVSNLCETVLSLAVRSGRTGVVRIILDEVKKSSTPDEFDTFINHIDSTGKDVLYHAIDCTDYEMVKLLIQAGCKVHERKELHLEYTETFILYMYSKFGKDDLYNKSIINDVDKIIELLKSIPV